MSQDGPLWQASGAHRYDLKVPEHLRPVAFIEGPSPDSDLYRVTCDPNDCSPGIGVEVSWDALTDLRDAIMAEEKRRGRK